MIILPTGSGPVRRIEHILFPTDFSPASRSAYSRVLEFAQDYSAQITIFHKLIRPVQPLLQGSVFLLGGGWVSEPDFSSRIRDEAELALEDWVKEAEALGLQADWVLDDKIGSSLSDSVQTFARRNRIDLVALGSHSSKASAALLGSGTRQIIRGLSKPVWVMQTWQRDALRRPRVA